MKKLSLLKLHLVSLLVLALSIAAFAQQAQVKSKVIDAKQLLADIQTLSADDMYGRATATPGGTKAREYVIKRFKESGLQTTNQDFEFKRRDAAVKGTNVYGIIKGKKNPEKYIIVTAHYDHVGVNKEQIFNGADDNASGTSALFQIAKYFSNKKPNNSVIIVAFDAEEMGLQGSRYFVANLPVKKENILLNINMDMISRNDKNELYAAGTLPYPHLKPHLEKVQKKSAIKLLLGHDDPKTGRDDWTFQSDQGSFHREKIPFIYFGVEDHADYHKPTDDFDKIHPKFYVHAVETVIYAIDELDKNLKQ